MKLLVADDEAKIRELIGKYAAFEGYDFLEAADGIAAVEQVRTQQGKGSNFWFILPALDPAERE